jgi:hypothetical protein
MVDYREDSTVLQGSAWMWLALVVAVSSQIPRGILLVFGIEPFTPHDLPNISSATTKLQGIRTWQNAALCFEPEEVDRTPP